MKSNLKNLSTIFVLFIFSIFGSKLFANDVIVDAEVVEIKEKGNLIYASGNVRVLDGSSIKIIGNEATYNKLNQEIEIIGNVNFFDNLKKFKSRSDKIIFERDKGFLSTFGNVKIEDQLNNYEITSEKIIYDKKNGILKSFDETQIYYNNKYNIVSSDISFNNNRKIFSSTKNTSIQDEFNNKFEFSSFNFDLVSKIIKAEKIKLIDAENNILELTKSYIDLKNNQIVGSDFTLNFNKGIFGNPENDPRLIGRSIISNKSKTSMKKSSFTTCKNVEGKCPTWSISASEVGHIKQKKRIEYKNAWLKIYDLPVAYFPYFFHPDPTVKRQSGFLFPQFINSSSSGFSSQIPYFKAIDADKDLTISPRIYSNNNLFIQNEYRQVFKNSNLITDFSYNKKNNSNSHFFSSLKGNYEDTFYEMKIESVSNKNYLKKYQIKSPLISSYSVLNSSILYEKYNDDYDFSSSVSVIEDLSKDDSDSFEFIIPNYNFSKETNLTTGNFFDSLKINSKGNYKKFNTNVDEADIVNDLILNSNNQSNLNNLSTDLSFLIRNINTYGNLSKSYKENTDYKILSNVMYNLEYPLIKETDSSRSFLTPVGSFRYSPNQGLNLKDENKLITYQDLFILDRINERTVESGASATLGFDYKIQNDSNQDKFNLGVGINSRIEEDNKLPLSSSLGQKTSDIIGYSGLNITENLSIKYNFSLDQSLSETNYSLISTDFSSSKFKTSFEYMEKSNLIGDESYLNNFTQYKINKSNSLSFETNKNIDKNLTNYYNLIYEYQNDCLQASVVYNKQFYKEDTINPGQNIYFKISFIPFGTISSPSFND